MVKSNADHGCEAATPQFEIATRCELENVRTSWNDGERCEVAEQNVAVVGQASRANPKRAARRNIRYLIDLPRGRRDAHDMLLIRLRGVEIAAYFDHAVPRSIRFKIVK